MGNQKGTKQAMLTGTVHKYRDAAGKRLMADPVVREAVFRQAVRGRAAYATAKGPKTDKQAGTGIIAQVGQAFVVDLSGMVPEQWRGEMMDGGRCFVCPLPGR
jgi:hypothetical protein